MGIKGTVRRNQDGHFIHANIDLDVIITEEVGGLQLEQKFDCWLHVIAASILQGALGHTHLFCPWLGHHEVILCPHQPELGSIEKPEEIFHIIEHFCLGRRRLHLFGNDSTIRPGVCVCVCVCV